MKQFLFSAVILMSFSGNYALAQEGEPVTLSRSESKQLTEEINHAFKLNCNSDCHIEFADLGCTKLPVFPFFQGYTCNMTDIHPTTTEDRSETVSINFYNLVKKLTNHKCGAGVLCFTGSLSGVCKIEASTYSCTVKSTLASDDSQ